MTPSPTFGVGDIVRLRSGSPKMTVTGIDGERVACAWFGESRGLSVGEFDVRCLVRALVPSERAA